jgi:alpha-amylase
MENGVMIQYFHWYYPDDGSLWDHLMDHSRELAESGITAVWLPPAFKGAKTLAGYESAGYDIYDMYDLGEFDQKGAVRTKYGTRQQYQDAIAAVHNCGLQVYPDILLNHKAGGDEKEKFLARKVNPENRNEFISEPMEVEAFTRFVFPGRQGKYSEFIWDYQCFSGIDFTLNAGTGVFKILNEYGDRWDNIFGNELGNFDYLMFNDIELRNPVVVEEWKRWGKWYHDQIGFNGMRLDAIKHISVDFLVGWLDYMRTVCGSDLFIVGEYWAPSQPEDMIHYIEATGNRLSLFDATLQQHFHDASTQGRNYNLNCIFSNTLVEAIPDNSVTLVSNHDTQPLQALESPVNEWFRPLAYAMILLRQGGYPCIFFTDLYGADYTGRGKDDKDYHIVMRPCSFLKEMLRARQKYSWGIQRDWIDHEQCIGWTREGTDALKGSGCAVILSTGDAGNKFMEVGKRHAGKTFADMLGNRSQKILIDPEGKAEFLCAAGSVSIWVNEQTLM